MLMRETMQKKAITIAPGEPCTRKIADLVPYALNNKDHPPAQIDRLAGFIREVGFRFPIAVDESDEIIAGHGRLLAAQKLGMAEVPCMRHVGLSKREKMALRIADNRLAELAVTNQENLDAELAGLADAGFDLELIGFDGLDLDSGDGSGAGDDSAKVKDAWSIIVECANESEQANLLDRFETEGLKCRALI